MKEPYVDDLNAKFAATFGRGLETKDRLIIPIYDETNGIKKIGEAEISRDSMGRCFLESFTIDNDDLNRIFDGGSFDGRLVVRGQK